MVKKDTQEENSAYNSYTTCEIDMKGYDESCSEKWINRYEYLLCEAAIVKETANDGTKLTTIHALKRDKGLKWHFSGRRDQWAHYLIENGFWKEMFGVDGVKIEIEDIKGTLSHKLVLSDILLNEYEPEQRKGTFVYGNWVIPESDRYRYSILKKLHTCWENNESHIHFSDDEWAWFFKAIFGHNWKELDGDDTGGFLTKMKFLRNLV